MIWSAELMALLRHIARTLLFFPLYLKMLITLLFRCFTNSGLGYLYYFNKGNKDPAISYYISTISTDPIFLLGELVLMQSKRLEDFLLKIAKNAEDFIDYGDEAQDEDGHGEDADHNDTHEDFYAKSLTNDFGGISKWSFVISKSS
jgi:hypothetical protein